MPNVLVQLVASLRYVLGGVPVPVVGRVPKRAEPSLICRYISQNPTFGGESGLLLSFANFNTVFFLQPQHNMLIIQALPAHKKVPTHVPEAWDLSIVHHPFFEFPLREDSLECRY